MLLENLKEVDTMPLDVEEMEKAVAALPADGYRKFRRWFLEDDVATLRKAPGSHTDELVRGASKTWAGYAADPGRG